MARFAILPADADIAASILEAPAWAQIGLSVRDPRLRERAAHELARVIVEGSGAQRPDRDQLSLSL